MPLADDIRINLGGGAVLLRPSLRHAICLERRPGGFQRLIAEVLDESLTAACEIIAPHYGAPLLMTRVFDAGLANLVDPLTRYVLACAGIEPGKSQEQSDEGGMPFAEYLQSLYRIGTGWLGWTPDTTLDSTPLEIREAYNGRLELLKAVFAGGEEEQPKPDPSKLGDKFRAMFGAIGTVKVARPEAA